MGFLDLDIHTVDLRFTTPLLEMSTDGTAIVWSSGSAIGPAADYAPDLYYFRPGDSTPRLIFSSSNRQANLIPVKVAEGGIVFGESFVGSDGLSLTWRIWYLAGPDASPTILDEADGSGPTAGPLPFFDVSERWIAWTAFHQTENGLKSQLLVRELTSGNTQVLESAAVERLTFWFPDLDGDRLVYSTALTPEGGGLEERHVYLTDLSDGDASPEELDAKANAVDPQIRGNEVVWKEVPRSVNLLNRGDLVLYDLRTGSLEEVGLGQPAASDPTIGNRFITGWGQDATIFCLYDVRENQTVEIKRYDPTGTEAIVRPVVAGDLVAFLHAPEDGSDLELQWATLPP